MKFNLILSSVLALSACQVSINGSSTNSNSEEKELDGVSRLQINGVFNLYLTQSDDESLTLDGSSELLEKLKVTQEGDLLILEMEEFNTGFFDSKDLRVNLSLSDLKELDFEGVGNVQTTKAFIIEEATIRGAGVGNLDLEFEAKELTVDLNMVGTMTLKGQADRVFLKNEGIGNLDAEKLIAGKMDLISSGIGKVEVHCVGDLSVQVDGIGKVSYSGNPNVIKKEISGIGKVEAN
jgi:hypothetical protein